MKIRLLSLAVALTAHGAIAAAQDAVFSDGFESGDFAAWDAAASGDGALTVEAGAALAGTSYGLRAQVNGRTPLYVEDQTPDDEARYRARFYFDPSAFDASEPLDRRRRTRIFIAYQEAPTVRVLAILLRRAAGQHSVAARVRLNDGSQVSTPFVPITPSEHWVEFEWNRASAPAAADGSFLLWLDGNLAGALTGLANGAGGVDFVRLGALSVRNGATGVLLFDQFASRELTAIGPSLVPGDVCGLGDQCGTGSCVDGVCCTTSSCDGTCRACDVALSEGSCTAIPGGQDPDSECGLVSCVGYYHGWLGDSCRRKANVSAAQASCNGSAACRSAAVECGAQTDADPTPVVTCHDVCQNPNLGTCTGSTAGTCQNVNPGNQTCGVGACVNTVPQCQNGAPFTCNPLPAGTETCNDIDDNCDGTVDNGAFGDGFEPNDACGTETVLNAVGSDQTQTYNGTLTVFPAGDADYYRIDATETDSSCSCGFPFQDEDYEMRVTLNVPANAGSYELCISLNSCVFGPANCVQVAAGGPGTARMWIDGACGPGQTDRYDIFVRVSGDGSPGFECAPYNLSYTFDAGYCR